MVLAETPESPMQIGALLALQLPPDGVADVFGRLRDHILERLPGTPLLAVLRQAPEGYDSDVWVDVADCDPEVHFERVEEPLDERALEDAAARNSMRPLDLARPPFRVTVFEDIGDGRCAMQLVVHHSVTDGVGFQSLLGRLSDAADPAARRAAGRVPGDDEWRSVAEARFEAEAPLRAAKRAAMDAALANIRGGSVLARHRTPTLKLSGPTSAERCYTRLSLSLEQVRSTARPLGATVNDLFLALASSALRRYLLEIDDLPDTPIVVNSARSYRRAEHGEFGNRIVALHPHLATTIVDPLVRLEAIKASMGDERARTEWDEAMLDQPERPYGARDRRAKFAERAGNRAAVLPGNITLSNVPGAAAPRSYHGFRELTNHPVPLLGSGRFLNVTSRRNEDRLDLGVMADPTKLADVRRFAGYLTDALAEYEQLGTG